MSRLVLPLANPYRSLPVAAPEPSDSLWKAQRVASWFVVGLALLRVGVCTITGLDYEGFIALVIVARSLS